MIYKYTHLGCMLNVFVHGGGAWSEDSEVTVAAHRDKAGVGEPRRF